MSYAEKTRVPVSRSQAELQRLLEKAGAGQVGVMVDNYSGTATIMFRMHNRNVRLNVPLPELDTKRYDQEVRRAWRVMVLLVKAKLEVISGGHSTVEREFLADVLLPNGSTVGNELAPQLDTAYVTGKMPPLLPGIGGTG